MIKKCSRSLLLLIGFLSVGSQLEVYKLVNTIHKRLSVLCFTRAMAMNIALQVDTPAQNTGKTVQIITSLQIWMIKPIPLLVR
jgi:hypothetical protein